MPLPCASLTPNRIDRNADARNVVYSDRSSDFGITPLSIMCWIANSPEMSAFASSSEAVGLLQLLPHGRLPAVDRDVVRPEAVHQLVDEDVREERVERRASP